MARKKVLEVIQTELTDQQQIFVEHLLTGKSITEAANIAGISRRAATYWLHSNDHLVRLEYDRLRLEAKDAFHQRIAKLHDLTLQALESALAEDAPPALRFAAAKFLYEAHLKDVAAMIKPDKPEDLVEKEVRELKNKAYFEQGNFTVMEYIPN